MKTPDINAAIITASAYHRGQKDKQGEPYILHPLRVMLATSDPIERIVAVLHDLIEDTMVTLHDLRLWGYPEVVIQAVDSISKRTGERLDNYYARVKANPIALRVKLLDIRDNLSRIDSLPSEVQDRLRGKYAKAIVVLHAGAPHAD